MHIGLNIRPYAIQALSKSR